MIPPDAAGGQLGVASKPRSLLFSDSIGTQSSMSVREVEPSSVSSKLRMMIRLKRDRK
jgi:hypothetical protein